MQESVARRVWQIAEPVVAHEGLELVDIEYQREGRGLVLRLYIDREGGVGLEDLSRISRQLSDVLDAHDAVPGHYLLECSSPGIRRRLRRPEHFARFIGKRVRVKLSTPETGRRAYLGTLTAVGDDAVTVTEADGEAHSARFANIARANYEPEE